MRPILLLSALMLVSFSLYSQISVNWVNFDITSKKIVIQNDQELLELVLEPNNALSQKALGKNPNVLSFDLINGKNQVVGKLTLMDDLRFIALRENGVIQSQKWIGNEVISHPPEKEKICGTEDSPSFYGQKYLSQIEKNSSSSSLTNLDYGTELATFKLALIGTGEFTAQNGGTEAAALATATNTVNALNLIFEVDLSASLSISVYQFYTDAGTDPFSPSGDARTNQAAEAMAMNFSDAEYDLGHVFHYRAFGSPWAGGGIAGLGVVCDNGTFFSTAGDSDGLTGPNKGAAWSGSFNNVSNSWVQLAAHEFGHQFSATHSFNGNGNANCNLGISSISAYEIGSGTTIMAYNGLCTADQNVPQNGLEDNYFHSTSLDQMRGYITSIGCFESTPTSNTIPELEINSATGLTIPVGTPFELEAVATDADNHNLTYTWEQIDEDGPGTSTHGFIGAAAANSSTAPLFKSVPPSESGIRTFPNLTEILGGNNENLNFEALPQTTRDINFSVTVRDGNGAVSSSNFALQSSSTAGPFTVLSQNSSTTWLADGIGTESITWDVANTDNTLINCQEVDILLSTDNGESFTYIMAENTPNDGEFTFTVPNIATTIGRIKIQASNNAFFDINNSIISIQSECDANGTSFSPSIDIEADSESPDLNLGLTPNYGSVISDFDGTLDISDAETSLAGESNGGCVNFGGNISVADEFNFQVTTSGVYTFTKSFGGFGLVAHIYEGDYMPSSPCTNWLMSSYSTSDGLIGNSLTFSLTAGINYKLVISGFNSIFPVLPDPYSYSCSGPGSCVSSALAPEGFNYLYVLVDTNNQIIEFMENSDFSQIPAGNYTIYGVSISESEDTSTYLGVELPSFLNDIALFTICANLSSNSIELGITGSQACLGDFNNDGIITASDLSTFLADFGCLSDCLTDLNGDLIVSSSDLTVILAIFGSSCP